MSRKLVKTIQTTQVSASTEVTSGPLLTFDEQIRLAGVRIRHSDRIQLRQSGISAREMSQLEFLRWLVTHSYVVED